MNRDEDPRYNAPPRLSDTMGDARRKMLVARADAATRAHIAPYYGRPRRTLRDRLLDFFNPPVASAASSPAARSHRDPSVEAGRVTTGEGRRG